MQQNDLAKLRDTAQLQPGFTARGGTGKRAGPNARAGVGPGTGESAGAAALRALVLRRHGKQDAGRALLAGGHASAGEILASQARHYGLPRADLTGQTPPRRLLLRRPPQFWLHHSAVPLSQIGPSVTIATARPGRLDALREDLRDSFSSVVPVLASEAQITALLARQFGAGLARQANCRVPPRLSCRSLPLERWQPLAAASLLPVLLAAWHFPALAFTGMSALALVSVLLFSLLKAAGLAAAVTRGPGPGTRSAALREDALPLISILVPLYEEARISKALVARLRQIEYPPALMDVILVLEAHDSVTRRALEGAELPPWVRVIEVPGCGGLTTKPRALNYALDFCRGSIIGVWDAEDAPEPGQLRAVARAFAGAPERTACFQGVLDYYNPHANWIARCFTLEYASWFRIVLQGIAQLGLVVPLGGTTMFIRREVLEELGGWDAHNVTEDADLGVRLCRAGYRTGMLPSATFEEANYRPWPWIKQRSRWLKGFMITYLVHMRAPGRLLRDLGWRRFLGFQAFFLGTVGQFLFAPFLWSFWLIAAGLPHPSAGVVPPALLTLAALALVAFELLGMAIAVTAACISRRPWLAIWAPALLLYFPLGAVAVMKAAYELLACPFFWDKTAHGLPLAGRKRRPRRFSAARARLRPASAGS
ncbi:glycosyltransferase family 2 protein [Cribrihabitans neustonicus]|uniref:glycosyltransferase family 2 protein n=1 Tax=Cribrihabitans neustonicus TaxID=1429085 RepID=UPI003B5A103D